jgi:hypothetical protein
VPVQAFKSEYMQRRIDNPSRKDVRDYFWREFTSAGLMHTGQVGAARCWWIEAQPFHAHLRRLAGEGITIYASPEDMEQRGWPALQADEPPPE